MKLSKHHVEILKTAESWINEIGYKVKTRDNGNVRSWIFDEGENTDGTKPFSITVIVDSEKDSHIVDVEMEDGSQVTKQINDKVKNDMFALGPDSPNSTSSDDDEQVDDDDNDELTEEDQKNMLYDAIIRESTEETERREEYNRQEEEEYQKTKKEVLYKIEKIKKSKIAEDKKVNKIIKLFLEYWDDTDITKAVNSVFSKRS
jgi:hypothetical protein